MWGLTGNVLGEKLAAYVDCALVLGLPEGFHDNIMVRAWNDLNIFGSRMA